MSDFSRIEEIFCTALQKPKGAEREAYLAEACRDAPEFLRAVEKLLAAHEQAGSFLDAPPSELMPTIVFPDGKQDADELDGVADLVGSSIGPYKLLEVIGEGGMGVVYMAEQHEPIRRRVALKIIKPGLDTRQVIARFEAERQALAMMDHPNIARVFDGGATATGRPFFVMELVRGVPITDYCDLNKLSVRARLELFTQVCQAVQHAHLKGIIHRDIKPSNVLVTLHDGQPAPKVIDFGVAKAINQQLTEKTLFTNFSQMVGTPLYMSPEQAEMSGLDVDTRTDIYSLGVLLYELLTGTTPFDRELLLKAGYDEMRRIIREQEPIRPSTRISSSQNTRTAVAANRQADPIRLSQSIRGDLDWIVMKSLEKDRQRRYETASGLAADIARYLTDQPVEAGPPSAVYRFRKFARRNRAALLTASTLVAALLLGVTISTWQAVRATRAERVAEEARVAEADQRENAEAQRALAEEKSRDAQASAALEREAKEEATRERDKALRLTMRTMVQSADQEISKAELLWKSGPQTKTEAMDALRSAAQIRQEVDALIANAFEATTMDTDSIRQQWQEQRLRLERAATTWMNCFALHEVGSFQFRFDRSNLNIEAVASPRGTRLAIKPYITDDIFLIDDGGRLLSRIPKALSIKSMTFPDESRLRVDTFNEVLEYELPAEPTAEPIKASRTTAPAVAETASDRIDRGYRTSKCATGTAFSKDGRLQFVPQSAGAKPRLLLQLGHEHDFTDHEFTTDGTMLAFVSHNPNFLKSIGMVDVRHGTYCTAMVSDANKDRNLESDGILPFERGAYYFTHSDFPKNQQGTVVVFRKWAIVSPEAPVIQLDAGRKATTLDVTSDSGLLTSLNETLSMSDSGLIPCWKAGGANGESSLNPRTDVDSPATSFTNFYDPARFVGDDEEMLVLRAQRELSSGARKGLLQVRQSSDGTQRNCPLPTGVKFWGSASDDRFLLYIDENKARPRTILVDAVRQQVAKEFEGLPCQQTLAERSKRVLAIHHAANKTIQFWKLPEVALLGEIPLAVGNSSSIGYAPIKVLVDREESCALVLQERASAGTNDSILSKHVTAIRFQPFVDFRLVDEMRLPRESEYNDVPLEKAGDNLIVVKVTSYSAFPNRDFLFIADTVTNRISTAQFGESVLCGAHPRVLINSTKADSWELLDLQTREQIQTYRAPRFARPEFTPEHFALNGAVYRWSDGQLDERYQDVTTSFGLADNFRLRVAANEVFLALPDREQVKLRGCRLPKDGASDKLPAILADNGATILMPDGLWDAQSGERLATWASENRLGYDNKAQAVLVRVFEKKSSEVRQYDLLTGKLTGRAPFDDYSTQTDQFRVIWGPRSMRLAVLTADGVDLIDLSTGKVLRRISHGIHLTSITHAATNPKAPVVLSASGGVVLQWKKPSGEFKSELLRSRTPIRDLDINDEGQDGLVSLESGATIVRSLSGRQRWRHEGPDSRPPVRAARFAADANVIVAYDDGALRKLSASDGSLLSETKLKDGGIQSFAMAPSGNFAYVLTRDQQIGLLDVKRFEIVKAVRLRTQPSAICAADNSVCFVGGDSIDAWSLSDGTRLCSLGAFGAPVAQLGFQAMSARIVAVDVQGREFTLPLKDVSDRLEALGAQPLSRFGRTAEEKLARLKVHEWLGEFVFLDEVLAAIDQQKSWQESTREDARNLARVNARADDELLRQVWRQLKSPPAGQDQLSEVIRIASAFRRRAPDNPEYLRLLACAYIQAGRPKDALHELRSSPSNGPLNLRVALMAHLANKDEPSARQVGEAIRANVANSKVKPAPGKNSSHELEMKLFAALAWGEVDLPQRLMAVLESPVAPAVVAPSSEEADIRGLVENALRTFWARGHEAVEKQNWTEAAENFALAVSSDPSNFAMLAPWSDAMAMAGRWKEAADVYAPAIQAGSDNVFMLWMAALLRLANDEQQAYRELCARLFEIHGATTNGQTAFMLALAASIGESGLPDMDRALAVAKLAVDSDVRNPAYWTCLGTAQFRAGKLQDAIETLKKAMPLHALAITIAPNMAAALQLSRLNGETTLALAYHKLGDQEAVDKQVATITKLIDTLEKSPPKPSPGLSPWAIKFAILISERELAGIGRQIERAK